MGCENRRATQAHNIKERKPHKKISKHIFMRKRKQFFNMQLSDLPNELLLHVFHSCYSIPDVLHLAATCQHFRSILSPSQRLPVLFQAAEAQFGPLADAISLVTQNASQPAHVPRMPPPLSLALLTRLVEVGRVANQWAAIYPMKKWRGSDSPSRRLLSSNEYYRVRRAVYRLWLYTAAFHTPLHARTTRSSLPLARTREALLHLWRTSDLVDMLDLHSIFRGVLESDICPSDSQVLRHHRARYPDGCSSPALLSVPSGLATVQIARAKQALAQDDFRHCSHVASRYHRRADMMLGWGDEISHYYVVEDMLKLDPSQLLYLFESVNGTSLTSPSAQRWMTNDHERSVKDKAGVVELFVSGLGDWFENNGETLVETVGHVVVRRGYDLEELKDEVEDGGGVVREVVRDVEF